MAIYQAITGSVTFTGRSGNVYTASNGAIVDVPPSDINQMGINNWNQVGTATYPGLLDVPQLGILYSDVVVSPVKVCQNAIPFIIPSSGSMANNGALTMTTALATTYSNGAYYYMPAGAIVAASAAGFYYGVASSTTAVTLYNTPYSSTYIQPFIPTTLVAFATTGPGAYTQTTGSNLTGPSWTVPAGVMGVNGVMEITAVFGMHSSTNNKIISITLGSGTLYTLTEATTGQIAAVALVTAQNQGLANAQVVNQTGSTGASATGQTYLSQNTANNLTLAMVGQLATATDYIVMDAISCTVTPG